MIQTFGIVEDEVMKQMTSAMEKSNAVFGALCADNHIGYSLPVGSVIGLDGHICVNGVGYDIACGNKAVRLDCDAKKVREGIYRTMNEIQSKISFGVGRKNDEKVDHPIFDDPIWNDIDLLRNLRNKARDQLGTVGSGNH